TRPGDDVEAAWIRKGTDSIYLSGHWDLLTHNARRRRLYRELGTLKAPADYRWDLHEISALDSGGAMLLWHIWGRQWPRELSCRDEHREWFERLQQTPSSQPRTARPCWAEHSAAGVVAVAKTVGGMLLLIGQIMVDA